ncbi:MAG: hypothetical protein ACLSVD_17850 [Eggerthellaceae bacterium]
MPFRTDVEQAVRISFVQASGLRHDIQRSADLYFVCCALAQADRVATD